jgi:hypothetical protein
MLLVVAHEDLRPEPDPVVADLAFVLVQVALQVAGDAGLEVVEVFLQVLVYQLELLDKRL